jgi:hypothetical protein
MLGNALPQSHPIDVRVVSAASNANKEGMTADRRERRLI